MMGLKERAFAPVVAVSLEELVPQDHFYRHLQEVLDLSFVYDLVREYYSVAGRPSVDPVVFFKLQLVMFFEDIRSERLLMRQVADRLSVRWYVGYDLDEPLPDHSTLSKIRTRYGLEVFRRFFEVIVEQCQQAKLVWGKELYFDATQIEANADLDSLAPRFAVEAREAIREHLTALFASEPTTLEDPEEKPRDSTAPEPVSQEETVPEPFPLPTSLSQTQREELAADNTTRHDWIAEEGRPQREVHGSYQRTADLRMSTTDPDATPMRLKGGGTHLGYHTHYVVDGGKNRIILSVLVVPGEVNDNQPILDLIWRLVFRWHIRPSQATGDMMYGTIEVIKALEDAHIRAYIPVAERGQRAGYYGSAQFIYDAVHDQFTCPQGHILRPAYRLEGSQEVQYRADAAICNACPVKCACTESNCGRHVHRPFLADYLDRVKAYEATFAYQKALNKRKVWVEPLFGEGKQWHGMRRFRLRRLWRVNCEALVIASGQNLKRLLQKRGWGRRPFPAQAVAMALPLASPGEKLPTNSIRTLRRRKVALAGIISLGLNKRESYASIFCFSLNSQFMTIFLVLSSSHISLSPFVFALPK
ncbi:MAG TPA: IS1182 family transposase [Ktedonobacteraceae bacterium]